VSDKVVYGKLAEVIGKAAAILAFLFSIIGRAKLIDGDALAPGDVLQRAPCVLGLTRMPAAATAGPFSVYGTSGRLVIGVERT
jgi:hypothetical protein